MRLVSSIALVALAFAAVSHAAFINLPTLYSCEPAAIRVLAKGNYTLEGRDLDTRKLHFRLRVQKGVSSVTWDAVDLPANATAIITVTDQIAASQTSAGSVQALVQPNPSGNTTCLADKKDKDRATAKQKNMVPTIIGIVLGAFFVLVLLLVAGMMYRRKKEKSQKIEEDSVDLSHSYSQAGGSYMARLVPGLKMNEARPLPRDPKLESEQADYASTRRGTHYYKSSAAAALDAPTNAAGYELPNYNQSQRLSRITSHHSSIAQPPFQVYRDQQQQQWQQHPSQPPAANPFASQNDLPGCYQLPNQMYQQNTWQHSQTSFLDKKSSR
ncbi:conserved hypothetical protein [Sporisorium reilianum SRZ2]|uniref:Mid2 domain-containing protein n=2 Tax=Sporisorium reilianum TaxID=72558 RepID=E6ZUR4_SPORE|nr:conserved hypothetical protein [Sporisorium reilianum SRZ2]SJX65996.1 uncharacterized protein SRS1_13439 [Sporisorium reilianum f. sp. reilianum]